MPLPRHDVEYDRDLAGRAILVTGATGGLGRALALSCAARGATVILHARTVRRLEALYDEIVGAGHPQPTILPLDLAAAGAADFAAVANAIRAQLGRLDAIVHTANMLGSLGPLEHQAFDAWVNVLRVDLVAAMAITRATMPLLAAAPDASVVFTLDARGEAPRAYWGAYAAAKAGLGALCTIIADEWEHRANLRVNAVVPGPINSPLRAQTHPGEERSRLPPPDALVPLYLHLIAGQPKAESAVTIDAQAWLAGQPASTPLAGGRAATLRP
jgi:NAD(P)-dependent dehydrogenase (short-subunit alcohol dehydrogenase family)